MADFPNFRDLFRIFRDEVLSRNEKLSLDAVERDGADANVLGAAASAVGEEIVGQLADVADGLFMGSATGRKLERLLFDWYGLVKKPASPSIGTVNFSTTATVIVAFTIPVGTTLQTSDGQQFLTTAVTVFPAGTVGPIPAPVRSALAGSKQNAKSGAITSITTTIAGAPSDLAVTNTYATAGADNAEGDSEFKERGRRFFTTARRGTLAAIEAAALATPGVVRAKAIEAIDVLGRPARMVELIIADRFTDALIRQGVSPPAYMTQSQQLGKAVWEGLSDVRAGGIFVQVRVAQTAMVPIVLQLHFVAGADVEMVALVARATMVATTNDLDPGDTLTLQALRERLASVNGLDIQGDEIASPAADVAPTSVLQVLRTSLDLVQASVQTLQDVQIYRWMNAQPFGPTVVATP